MQFTLYRSTDTSAPVLTGAAGSLISLLDAILVNGYGSQAAAGWTHTFTTTSNIAMYTPGSGTGRILRVQDDASLTGGARDTIIRGVESATALSTFTNPYPTVSQQTNGVNWRKSTTADATARAWFAAADSRTLYLFVQSGDNNNTSSPNTFALYAFGDFFSYVPSDAFNSMVIGAIGTSASAENFQSGTFYAGDLTANSMQAGMVGHYCDRGSTGLGSSTNFSKKGCGALKTAAGNSISNPPAGILAFPNTSDGGLYLHPMWVMDSTTPDVVHGELRGLYDQPHPISNFGDQDTFGGAGAFSGRTFLIAKQTPLLGVWIIETSNTLNTN